LLHFVVFGGKEDFVAHAPGDNGWMISGNADLVAERIFDALLKFGVVIRV
jgi:hypothetical protein